MYPNGERVEIGDIVRGSGGEGEVLEVVERGAASGGVEDTLVQWFAEYEVSPGYKSRKAPVQVPTQSLALVKRKS